jgi:general secretion pathway protein K
LIAVLWMVAALSIIVMGLSTATRKETQRTAHARHVVQGQAVGDAVIQLALQRIMAKPPVPTKIAFDEISFEGQAVAVRFQPLSGLIDINSGSKELLTALFKHAGQLDPATAEGLAVSMIEMRTRKDARNIQAGFEAPEDLLGVPGIDYALYAKIVALVTADVRGSGRVNPLAALPDVLTVIADGDAQKAAQIDAARREGTVGIDTTGLNAAFVDASGSQRVRIQAAVPLADGSVLLNERSVELLPSAREGMPWRTFRVDRRMAPRANF